MSEHSLMVLAVENIKYNMCYYCTIWLNYNLVTLSYEEVTRGLGPTSLSSALPRLWTGHPKGYHRP